MRHKRNLKINKVVKHKLWLNIDGLWQELAVNYFQINEIVVTGFAIVFFLVLATTNEWHFYQVDFVMAYPWVLI